MLDEMMAEDLKHAKTLNKNLDLGEKINASVEEWDRWLKQRDAKVRPNLEEIARQLAQLLPADEAGKPQDMLRSYNNVYRTESKYSAHPSASLFLRYLQLDPAGERDGIILNPGPPFSRQDLIGLGLTLHLATHVFKAFGIVVDERLTDLDSRVTKEAERLNQEAEAHRISPQ